MSATLRTFLVPVQSLRFSPSTIARPFSSTTRQLTKPPPGNFPPSAKAAGRTTHVSEDRQSSASTKSGDEHKSGDDHPAKQPDGQAPSERSTGFQEVDEVKGGKEGLGARTDK